MSSAEESLGRLDEAALIELTNAGTVRRARKELDQIIVEWSREDSAWVATSSDETVQRIGAGHFDTWSCSCPAEHKCRHIVRAVLLWQRNPPLADTDTAAEDPATSDAVAEAADFLPQATQQAAQRLIERGVLAQVSRTPRLLVRLLHPEHLNIRFSVASDLRYARCECGAPHCVHLALAGAAAAALEPGLDGGLVRIGQLAGGPSAADVEEARTAWRSWLGQFLDAGLGAVDHLLGSAVRLASVWEGSRLEHPGAAIREIAEQLEHHRGHDAQLSPERLLVLIGEVESRLASLGSRSAPAPRQVVAGAKPIQIRRERTRLLGLGAEYRHVGGWNQLRVHLLDMQTGAVSSLVAEADDTEGNLITPAGLLARRVNSVPLGEWAAGMAIVPGLRRTGGQLVIGRGRVSVAANQRFDPAAVGAVAPRTLTEVSAALPELPEVLGPRGSTDAIMLLPVAGVAEVEFLAGRALLRARIVDTEGADAELALPWGPRTQAAARAAHAALADPDQPVVAVAGRWQRTGEGLRVIPSAIWTDREVLLPQGAAAQTGVQPASQQGSADPWQVSWEQVAEQLGALLVLGARRGAERMTRELATLSLSLQAHGLSQTAGLIGELAEGLPDPERRIKAVVALCVRLAFQA